MYYTGGIGVLVSWQQTELVCTLLENVRINVHNPTAFYAVYTCKKDQVIWCKCKLHMNIEMDFKVCFMHDMLEKSLRLSENFSFDF